MKIVRFQQGDGSGRGLLRGNTIEVVNGDIFENAIRTNEVIALEHVKILPPVSPSKIIAAGLNYYSLANVANMPVPDEPLLFFKPPSSIIGPLEDIICPPNVTRLHYEGELTVVIGKRAKDVDEAQALQYVFGYTIGNDVSAMDFMERDRQQTTRVKGFDTFSPVGPVIATGIDPDNLHIETRVNGKIVQASSTKDMIFKTSRLVSFISCIMTLLPGDLIMTGTPSGVGPLKRGDVVEVEIEDIGILKNAVT